MEMTLVETHNIVKTHRYWYALDELCYLSKNLYNATMYRVRQYYIETGNYLNYYQVNKEFTDNKQDDYVALPAKVSKWTQRLVDHDFNTFFGSLRAKKQGKINKDIRLPRYAKKDGRKEVFYEKGALSFKKKGYIKLSKTEIYIKTRTELCNRSAQPPPPPK